MTSPFRVRLVLSPQTAQRLPEFGPVSPTLIRQASTNAGLPHVVSLVVLAIAVTTIPPLITAFVVVVIIVDLGVGRVVAHLVLHAVITVLVASLLCVSSLV